MGGELKGKQMSFESLHSLCGAVYRFDSAPLSSPRRSCVTHERKRPSLIPRRLFPKRWVQPIERGWLLSRLRQKHQRHRVAATVPPHRMRRYTPLPLPLPVTVTITADSYRHHCRCQLPLPLPLPLQIPLPLPMPLPLSIPLRLPLPLPIPLPLPLPMP